MKFLHNNRHLAYLVGIGALLLIPAFVLAQEPYVSLTPIPGVTSSMSFGDFLNAMFKIGLAVAATLAVVMITIGGLEYMTTDSISGKSEGKERITNAVIGLLIALLIWVILYTINPNLIKFDISIPSSQGTSSQNPAQNTSNKGGGGLGGVVQSGVKPGGENFTP